MATEQFLEAFRNIVGSQYVLISPGDLESYGRDWTKIHEPKPLAIVFPGSTVEVAKVVRYCHDQGIAMVPSGGRTGLAAGAVAASGEVVISLNRLNKIEDIDPVGLTVRVQAGVTTQEVQEAANDVNLFFPLDLAAKGSCQIGGNIATNAGGVKFIRYGGMREQVLGLEVVMPNGEVLNMNTGLRKNNTGYDLRQLFIGAEGTLGIITSATLRLTSKPRNVQASVMAVHDFNAIPKILGVCNQLAIQLTAFEFFTKKAHEIVLQHAPGARTPFSERYPYYVLLEVEEGPAGGAVMEPLLEKIFADELIADAVVSSTSAEFKELWGLRENITESIAAHGHARKNDIALAINQLSDFITAVQPIVDAAPKDMELVLFGHIGDGNLHINYVGPKSEPFKEFQARARKVEEQVFAIVKDFKGSISAEHGIGLLKKKDLHYSRPASEVDVMRQIKRLFDPKGLMNPGKIFDI